MFNLESLKAFGEKLVDTGNVLLDEASKIGNELIDKGEVQFKKGFIEVTRQVQRMNSKMQSKAAHYRKDLKTMEKENGNRK